LYLIHFLIDTKYFIIHLKFSKSYFQFQNILQNFILLSKLFLLKFIHFIQ
jgi:hypothetical protein